MFKTLISEFDCNHQADLGDSDNENDEEDSCTRRFKARLTQGQQKIYRRENEHNVITRFLVKNLDRQKSGLIYLCGHPGTGKTSSLNQILQKLRNAAAKGNCDEFQLYMYNAMPFTDAKSFALSLL